MGGKASQLSEMSWETVRDLDRGRTVAILPVGAVEAHGPHLPLSTDVVIAEAMAREGARRLAARGVASLVLPSLAYTTAGFAESFAGTISIAPATVTALVLDVARSLARQGFAALALANAHLDPDHLAALHAAVEAAGAEGLLPVVFPDLTRRPWGSRLTDEFRSGACHAGRFEGSVVLAERPELVDEAARLALPEVDVSLSEAIRAGRGSFEAAGMEHAYCGAPAEASAREGRETVAALGGILADAVAQAGIAS
ncbi:MAG TPA: creatininase family protein [Gemmatimonadota bacterium]|nr:creatininase family protein [Gemmatimonadota bacterium]